VRIPSHCAGDEDNFIRPTPNSFPLLNHDPLDGELYQIRYNNSDRSTLDNITPELVLQFYRALRAWNALVRDPSNEYWVQLVPGRVVVFDNWRVLHGRAAYTGRRRLVGAYLNKDDYLSKLRLATMTKDGIRQSI
jgi:trimethyllysine dioxygenase